jgi:stage V sporulation protein R
MEYEEMQRGYEFGLHKIYEMVINNDPCLLYCLNTNTLLDDILVIIHATGHNHFFKNNIYFQPTNRNMINTMAQHGTVMRDYMSEYGQDRVLDFIDRVLCLETLIDPAKAWEGRQRKDLKIRDTVTHEEPYRIPVAKDRMYMDSYLNPKWWIDEQREAIKRNQMAEEIGLFKEPTRDVLGHLRDHAPLKMWQADIVSMIYDEAQYFDPQRKTKTINEGFASWFDHKMMAEKRFSALGTGTDDGGIFEYAIHKMGVLGGANAKYSMNPYKVGMEMLLEIEDRWNKGRFGPEYAACTDMRERENWDTQKGKGKEKVFEVCKYHDDMTLISEFFDQDFCDKHEFFAWKKRPSGEYVVESKDAKVIRKRLMKKHLNGGLPEIRLVDPNFKGKGYYLLEHVWDGRTLYDPYARDTIMSVNYLWGNDVYLTTKNKHDVEIIYMCVGHDDPEKDVMTLTRDEYEKKW